MIHSKSINLTKLVVEPTHLKKIGQIGSFHQNSDENKQYFKPPGSFDHLEM